jgi:hypothetical protein
MSDIRLHGQQNSTSGSYLGSLGFKPRLAEITSFPRRIHYLKQDCQFLSRNVVVKHAAEYLCSYSVLSSEHVHILGLSGVRVSEKYVTFFFSVEFYAKN